MTIESLDRALLIGAVVLLVAIAAVQLSARSRLPTLLLYLALGLALGEGALGVEFDDAALARALGYAALVLILAEGGLTTSWRDVRRVVPAAASLATVGTVVSIAVVAAVAHWGFGLEWQLGLLIGAVVSSTDAAAVFSLMRQVSLPPRIAGLLEAESGFNDAPVVLIVVALSTVGLDPENPVQLALVIVLELLGGTAIGLLVGWGGAAVLRRLALPSSGLYPLAVLALSIGAYGAASAVHASGFIAVYLAALVLGNANLPHRPATRGFAEGVAWLAQIGLFVMLGLLATPSDLARAVIPALVVGFTLLLLARPLSVVAALLPFRVPLRDQVFVAWAGLRGAVPIVLATVPVVAGVPGSADLFDLVFVLVIVFTLIQAPSLPLVARWLRLTQNVSAREVDIESSPLQHLGAVTLELGIPAASRLAGVDILELRLPRGAAVTLVVRDGQSFVPESRTTLRHGDELLLVTTTATRRQTEERLQAVSRDGRLAGWVDESRPPP
jgi:cell volume regulation protein A